MAYTQTTWEDRNVEFPNRFTLTDNGDGTFTILAAPGTVTKSGTPISSTNMQKIEQALASAIAVTDTYTPADILAKLKTVDGAGSGLDADTVRGYVPVNKAGDTIKYLDFTSPDGTKNKRVETTNANNLRILNNALNSTIFSLLDDGTLELAGFKTWTEQNLRTTNGYLEVLIGGSWKKVGGGVKSIQKVLVGSIGSGATTNFTISPVNPAKCVVTLGGLYVYASDGMNTNNYRGEVTSSTNFQVVNNGLSVGNLLFYITEYE